MEYFQKDITEILKDLKTFLEGLSEEIKKRLGIYGKIFKSV